MLEYNEDDELEELEDLEVVAENTDATVAEMAAWVVLRRHYQMGRGSDRSSIMMSLEFLRWMFRSGQMEP